MSEGAPTVIGHRVPGSRPGVGLTSCAGVLSGRATSLLGFSGTKRVDWERSGLPLDGTQSSATRAGAARGHRIWSTCPRRTLAARGKTIRLVSSWSGPFGVEAAGEVLLPGPDARLAETTFDAWLAEAAR
jgi:hypothetical protein